jgi:DNA-binding NarL/FixJ family response regulator
MTEPTDTSTPAIDQILNVLLVDDDEFFRLNLTQRLEEAGYRVSTAFDLTNAASLCEQYAFDVALIDLNLQYLSNGFITSPNWQGITLGKQMLTHCPEIRLIFLSEQLPDSATFEQLTAELGTKPQISLKALPQFEKHILETLKGVSTQTPLITDLPKIDLLAYWAAQLSPLERPFIEMIWQRLPRLTPMEFEIVTYLAESKRPTAIGQRVNIIAIDNAISRIYSKLGLAGAEFSKPTGFQRSILLAKAVFLYQIKYQIK